MHVLRCSLGGYDHASHRCPMRDEDRIIGERQEIQVSVGGFIMLGRRLPVP